MFLIKFVIYSNFRNLMSLSIRLHPFTFFYAFIFFCTILFIHTATSYFIVVKPMIMCSLIGFYIAKARYQSNLFILGMISALLGDIFIHFPGEVFFITGVCFFLIMQVLFAYIFFKDRKQLSSEDYYTVITLFIIGCTVAFLALPRLGVFKIPVLIYALMNCAMTSAAWLRKETIPGYYYVVTGAVLFMFSDLCLGFERFIQPFPFSADFIMAFYMLAQYLMVTGFTLKHNSSQRQTESSSD